MEQILTKKQCENIEKTKISQIRERLEEWRKRLKISQVDLSKNIGVPQATYSKFIVKGNTLSKVVLLIIERYPDINVNWLIRGEGPMLVSSIYSDAVAQARSMVGEPKPYAQEPPTAYKEWISSLTTQITTLQEKNTSLERENAVLTNLVDRLTGKAARQ